jgi:hypothetical protein
MGIYRHDANSMQVVGKVNGSAVTIDITSPVSDRFLDRGYQLVDVIGAGRLPVEWLCEGRRPSPPDRPQGSSGRRGGAKHAPAIWVSKVGFLLVPDGVMTLDGVGFINTGHRALLLDRSFRTPGKKVVAISRLSPQVKKLSSTVVNAS